MKQNEERIAEHLEDNLVKYFKEKNELVNISKEGAGVHWNCILKLNNRLCKIHCFEDRDQDNIKPEYLTSFEELGENKAYGRTYDLSKTIYSCEYWVKNESLKFLYNKFEFIDWMKRRIISIENKLLEFEPQLSQTIRELDSPWGSGLYDYEMKFNARSCELVGYGVNKPVTFSLKWDDCKLFDVRQNDLELMANVLKKWLIEGVNPTTLKKHYDWLEINDLALHYEKGEGVKGEFIESWNRIENYYQETSEQWFSGKKDSLKLISEMRSSNLDYELRAGQSLMFFILSRSRRHGLDENHPYIHITFMGENRMKVRSRQNKKVKEFESDVSYTGEFKEFVNKLKQEQIE